MQTIFLMLNGYSSVNMPLPQEPAFFLHSRAELNVPSVTSESSNQLPSNSVSCSVNEVSITELYPR